jgi:leucyl aminopeptidase
MHFEVKSANANELRSDIAIVAVYEKNELGGAAKSLDKALGGAIGDVLKRGDIKGRPGDLLLLTHTAGANCERILLVGCGKRKELNRQNYRKAVQVAYAWLATKPYKTVACCLSQERVIGADTFRAARIAAEVWHQVSYRFTQMKSTDESGPIVLDKLVIVARDTKHTAALRKGIAEGDALGKGMNLSRDLANLPPNVCTPTYLAEEARSMAKAAPKLTCKILTEGDMRKLGMGSLLSVTAGSVEPAQFIILEYKGAAASKAPTVLVGKGITFDTGGISLKPPAAMDEMKFDMSGAASVLGTFKALVELQPKLNVVGLIPTCENMPGGSATKPGDIVKSMSGLTIEILNTDAEGRLILCDALTYARRYKPAAVIDIATLTGACVIALGKHFSGLLSTSDSLARDLQKAGDNSDDRAWRLPLTPEYAEQLKSNFADVANVGGREAGTITAASFLSKFTTDMNWAHLDIAGTAYQTGAAKGSSGRPVPLLLEFLLNS